MHVRICRPLRDRTGGSTPNPSSPRFLFRPPPPPSPTTSGRLFRSPRSSPPMRALPRGAAASLLRAAAAAAPCRPRPVQLQRRLPDADRLLAMVRVLPPSPHPPHSSSDPSCVGCPILCGILIAVCLQVLAAVLRQRFH